MSISAKTISTSRSSLADADAQQPVSRQADLESRSSSVTSERPSRDLQSVLATIGTTFFTYFIFLVQGVLVARILGPEGRGEFGTAIYFPRDILLYAGLLGGIDIVNSYASRKVMGTVRLKYSALKLGIVSGLLTAGFAAILSTVMLFAVGKAYLLPYCYICCLFVPWEHVHHVVSAVDRGKTRFMAYNVNRIWFALAFPLMVGAAFSLNLQNWLPGSHPSLMLVCILFVLSRIIGLLPTLRGMSLWKTLVSGKDSIGSVSSKNDQLDSEPTVRRLLSDGRPYAFSVLATELFERLDVLLIVMFAAVEMSGHYFVAVPAAALLTVAPNAVSIFTFNAGANPDRRFTVKQAVGFMSATALFQIVSACIFCYLIPALMIIVFTDKYVESIPFVLALAPACAIKGYLQTVDGYLKGRGKPLIGVWSRIFSIGGMLIFFALTYPSYQLISIPMAACFGQLISMVLLSWAAIVDVRSNEPRGVVL